MNERYGRVRAALGAIALVAVVSVSSITSASMAAPVSRAPQSPHQHLNGAPPSLIDAIHRAKLTASDGAAHDEFGYSVSVSGDTAVVGVIQATPGGGFTGTAYVYVRSGTWTPQAKLTAPDEAAGDAFGFSVSVSGDTAVIGAYGDDNHAGNDAGSAYVFVRSGSTWNPQAKLMASDGVASGTFGYSVAISGDTALVGAIGPAGVYIGSAYVFVRTGTSWTQQAKLAASDGAELEYFGISVSISGDTALVGAYRDNTPVVDAGSAYVFVRSGPTWTEQKELTASDGAAGDAFGLTVAMSGETAMVGASGHDTPAGAQAGAAYVFVRSGSTWTEQELTASDGAQFDGFGSSVAVSGDRGVVGAPGDNTPAGRSAGSAYLFVGSGSAWIEQGKLTAPDGAADDVFGWSVSVSGDTVLVGAPDDDTTAGTDAGSAYVVWR